MICNSPDLIVQTVVRSNFAHMTASYLQAVGQLMTDYCFQPARVGQERSLKREVSRAEKTSSVVGTSVYLDRRMDDVELRWDQRFVMIWCFGVITDHGYVCGKDAVTDTPDVQIRSFLYHTL